VAVGYGRTYTLLYGQWIYGAPTVDLVMAVTWSGVVWWGRVPTHDSATRGASRQRIGPCPV